MAMNQQGDIKEVVIPREKAVFWMDGRGRWHNQHGPFQHKKIIAHFNASIKKDDGGYFVSQFHNDIHEKVYFPYQETALFVVDLLWGDPARLVLNTGEILDLIPKMLFLRQEQIFHEKGQGEIVKFTERALTLLAEKIEHRQGSYVLLWGNEKVTIPERQVEL